jgi:hypothetical protein
VGIPEPTIASLVGHKRQGETFGTYSRGSSMEQFGARVEPVELDRGNGKRRPTRAENDEARLCRSASMAALRFPKRYGLLSNRPGDPEAETIIPV